jgi:3-dehydroquinate synthase/shikimate kinase/3-dehydroquinate synthase
MGVGKSTIGRRLAQLIDRPFFDSDAVIVERAGMSIQAMFNDGQEQRFRQTERDVIAELAGGSVPSVIALGGGALNDNATLELLLETALLVHIHLPWESFEELIPRLRRGRPLLNAASTTKIHELYLEREARYQACHLTVELQRDGVRKSAGLLCDALAPYGIRGAAEPQHSPLP